jgi:hypothetical protein
MTPSLFNPVPTDFRFDLKSVGTGLDRHGHEEFTENSFGLKWVEDGKF